MRGARRASVVAALVALGTPAMASAQTFAVRDSVLERMWRLGTDSSRVERLGQALAVAGVPRRAWTDPALPR
jgi:hypothetical protein